MNHSDKRDVAIDIVRGIAIFIMVAANMAPVLKEQPSYWIRGLYSCAAPIFIVLAGAMVGRSILKSSSHSFVYFLERGLFLLAMGAMIDVVASGYIPFLGVDVLYLLGVSMPILCLIAKCSTWLVASITASIFLATFMLQNIFGYIELPTMIYFGQKSAIVPSVIFRHWMVDGWFPLFPWMGYGTVGILLARLRWQDVLEFRRFDRPWIAVSAISIFMIGLVLMNAVPGAQYARYGYQELFYPVTPGFLLWSLAMVVGVIAVVDATVNLTLWRLVQPLGEASLFVYLSHAIIIGKVYVPFFSPMTHQRYLAFFAILFGVMFLATSWLRGVRKTYQNMPTKLRWVIG